jgi:hypothetical protein
MKLFKVKATPDHGSWFLEFPGTTDWVTSAEDVEDIQVMAKDLLSLATDLPIDEIELDVHFETMQYCETEEAKEFDREDGTVHSCEFVKTSDEAERVAATSL